MNLLSMFIKTSPDLRIEALRIATGKPLNFASTDRNALLIRWTISVFLRPLNGSSPGVLCMINVAALNLLMSAFFGGGLGMLAGDCLG